MNRTVAMYLRLSRDDGDSGESAGIESQRQIINEYIKSSPDLEGLPLREFVDDGYSGTSFKRPAVESLIEAVKEGETDCVIVKDFSRFGRQYLEVSKYIEQIFPSLGVRFISINDGYDSADASGFSNDIGVPVKNMIYAMYSRDISQKVKSAKRTQIERGIFSNAFAPYGYKKDIADGHKLLIDEPAAEVVRLIYALACEGHSSYQIAVKLNEMGIITPALYKRQSGSRLAVGVSDDALWRSDSVAGILHDERYTGTLIGAKHETANVGSGKKRQLPENSWVRIPDAVPAIITHEVWDSLAAGRRKNKSGRPDTGRFLYKRVRCGYCGRIMRYRKTPNSYFTCDTARYTERHGCYRRLYREKPLTDTVKTVLSVIVSVFLDMEMLHRESEQKLESIRNKAVKLEREIKRLQYLKHGLYERYKSGALSHADFSSELASVQSKIDFKKQAVEIRQAPDDFFSPIRSGEVNALVEAVYVYDEDRIEIKLAYSDADWYDFFII